MEEDNKQKENNNQLLKIDIKDVVDEEKTEKEESEKKELEIVEVNVEKKKISKKTKIIIIAICCSILLIALLFSTIFALININNKNIIQGISINGVDVSNVSFEDAKARFTNNFQEIKSQNITLEYEDFQTTITLEQISTSINIDQVVEEAYNMGRNGNIFKNNYEILARKINPVNLQFTMEFNQEESKNILDNISYSLPNTVVQSSYSIEGNNLVITKGKKGIIVDQNQMTNLLGIYVHELMQGKEAYNITIPVIEIEPNPIDIDKIHSEIYKEPKNASIKKDPFELTVHSNGVDFDVNNAKEIITQDQEQYTIPLVITTPEITVDKLGEEAFPNLLGSYSTNYGASASNRGINIAIAARTINGTILLPGEVFSYNKVIGDTTPNKGYKLGGSYLNGELVESYGGGICQVSSTLYNAVLYANLDIVLRYNHSSTVGYVPASRDATVSYGGKDFKFKNSRKYPIRIKAVASNGVLKIEIYGIKEEEEYEVVIESSVTGSIPFTTKYIEDNTLPQGQQVVKSNGSNGKKSVAYKVLKLNGVVVSRTLLSQDTYNPMQRIVRVGTKKTVAQSTTKPAEPTTETTAKPAAQTQNQTQNQVQTQTQTQNQSQNQSLTNKQTNQ